MRVQIKPIYLMVFLVFTHSTYLFGKLFFFPVVSFSLSYPLWWGPYCVSQSLLFLGLFMHPSHLLHCSLKLKIQVKLLNVLKPLNSFFSCPILLSSLPLYGDLTLYWGSSLSFLARYIHRCSLRCRLSLLADDVVVAVLVV